MALRAGVLAVFFAICVVPEAQSASEPQVALEVRLVSVSDNFFERMGVQERSDAQVAAPKREQDVDFQAFGQTFLSDGQLRQFLEAVQGDRRCRVLQAPRMTLLNNQLGSVENMDTKTFVTGIDWVSSGGQARPAPKSESIKIGFNMSAKPVVSADRRSVQLAFKFQQTELTWPMRETPVIPVQIPIAPTKTKTGTERVEEPIMFQMFLQQPQVRTLTIDKTVTIPDGGTAVFCGLKTASETPYEVSTPLLSKIPYLSRLFTNVAYRPEMVTQVILVTPRILDEQVQVAPPRAVVVHRAGEPLPREIPFPVTGPKGNVLRVQHVAAADLAAATINDYLAKKLTGAADTDKHVRPAVAAEPLSNTLLVSARADDLAEIKRLVAALDVAPKQFHVQVVVYEGKPGRAEREPANILTRPQVLTLENQTALVTVGREVEIPTGGGEKRKVNAGVTLQVTVGRASGKQVPVRMVTEINTINEQVKGRATLETQHTESSANYPLGERVLIRGGMTNSGKELWIAATVTEITSREQLLKLNQERRNEE